MITVVCLTICLFILRASVRKNYNPKFQAEQSNRARTPYIKRVKAELKLAKLRNIAINNESLTTELRIVVDASAHRRRVLEEEMRLEKSDEYMDLPQGIEKVHPLKNERAHILSVVPDAVAQPVTVGEEKGLPRNSLSSSEPLISADERCLKLK
ncbi:hypothetical protein TNIN_425481 [Trichonephila inaurata madagascariensis]|uniref:Uncharacterized protein n=1 Tax=Trichonephila inaurata madagascariensis TaxID=2747483 RepID=A0A8X6XQY0_9ARAC|nr:hypothetical protein TNIN_425481 [Trichonephila inaurata madagascariensis]